MSLFDTLERKLVDGIKSHLRITNEIAHTDEHLDLITTASYNGRIIMSHRLDLNPLYETFKQRLEDESFYAKIEEELDDASFLSDIDSHIASLEIPSVKSVHEDSNGNIHVEFTQERDTSLDDIG